MERLLKFALATNIVGIVTAALVQNTALVIANTVFLCMTVYAWTR